MRREREGELKRGKKEKKRMNEGWKESRINEKTKIEI